ncbi:hypothetical protein ACJX0J_036963, partial [Zea mays]
APKRMGSEHYFILMRSKIHILAKVVPFSFDNTNKQRSIIIPETAYLWSFKYSKNNVYSSIS